MKATKNELQNDKTPIPANKTLCTIQLTRIGDILQTYQAALLFKKQYPQFRHILIARKRFARPLSFLLRNTFDKVYYVDNDLFGGHSPDSLNDSIHGLKTFLTDLKQESISVIVNLSFSRSSGYLTSLIPSEHKMGLTIDPNNNVSISDKWSQYIYSNVMGGPLNPFNLVDIYKTMLGYNLPYEIKEVKTPANVKKIVIHPFASHAKKMWKINKWEEIIYQLLKNHPELEISMAGSESEVPFASKLASSPLLKKYTHRLKNRVGKTSLEDLYNLFDDTDLFIGHDSMVGHMAAIKHVPTITISLGTVRPKETTPYGENNYNLTPVTNCFPCFPDEKCDFYQCHSDIPYQVIYNALKEFITTGGITREYQTKHNSCFHLNSVAIYKSTITPIGFQQLNNILEEKFAVNDIFSTLYRICWQFILNSSEEQQAFPSLNNKSHQILLDSMKGLQHLYELCDFGKKYSRYILEEISAKVPRLEKIKEYSNKIDDIDGLSSLVKKTHPYLSPIVDYYIVQKGNLIGGNIVELTESSFLMYHDAINTVSILYELIEKTIMEHKSKTGIKSTANAQLTNR